MNKRVIGLVGEIASGKDTVANYLVENCNAEIASFSQPLRDILDILGLPQTRENMIWLGVDLRTRFGQDILAKAMLKIVKASQAPIICLPNVRLTSDIVFFNAMPKFYLVHIITDPKIRFERLKNRGQNPDDGTKTWEKFLEESELPTEIAIRETARGALFDINNNGDLANLFQQVKNVEKATRHGDEIYA